LASLKSALSLPNTSTMKVQIFNKLIAAAALALCSSMFAADAAPGAKPAGKSPVKGAPASGEVKKDMEKFSSQRDAMLAERQALINQLKNATEEQRKAILEKMKEMGAAQRELSKQIRDDLRKLRQGPGSPGRG
jgi:septal ring factor EnvC (AmiA/AmiB activator)